jgi:hypothetical protein
MSVIHGKRFIEALLESGVVTKDERVRRVVIDASADNAVVMYVERYGDSRLIEVVLALTGVEIRQTDKPAEKEFFIQDPNRWPGEGTHVTEETLRQATTDDPA